jgi:hypothetical protein
VAVVVVEELQGQLIQGAVVAVELVDGKTMPRQHLVQAIPVAVVVAGAALVMVLLDQAAPVS